jgi:hypothetical protein
MRNNDHYIDDGVREAACSDWRSVTPAFGCGLQVGCEGPSKGGFRCSTHEESWRIDGSCWQSVF